MLPAPGNIGRFCSSHLPGETRTLPSPPRLNAWLRAAARLKGAASSTSGRNCWRNALLDTTSTEFPPASLAQEPASTAANPKGLQEPPLPSSCTGYFLLNRPQYFQPEKSLLELTHAQSREGLSAYKLKFVNH